MRFRAFTLVAATVVVLAGPLDMDGGEITLEQREFFEKKIRPALVENCFRCHGGDKVKGKLRLDSRASLLTGGQSGPAIVPGDPAKSLLIKAIGFEDTLLKMPKEGKLPDAVIADITAWVRMGAPWPDE